MALGDPEMSLEQARGFLRSTIDAYLSPDRQRPGARQTS
jgi:hypothetical protein